MGDNAVSNWMETSVVRIFLREGCIQAKENICKMILSIV